MSLRRRLLRWTLKELLVPDGSKADTFYPAAGQPGTFNQLLPRTRRNYAAEVGDGLGSSVLMAPMNWIRRAWPEATLEIARRRGSKEDVVEQHPLIELIERPNEHYSGEDLWSATELDFVWGDAYWRKVRTRSTSPVDELWYVPAYCMTPKWPADGSVFISHYEYRAGDGRPVNLAPEEVVHFRNGINPRNTRQGVSEVYAALREIFSDDEAANFAASLLQNMGVPGILISPDTDDPVDFDEEEMKQYLLDKFTGDDRGKPLAMGMKTKVQPFGFDPQKMTLSNLRNIAEERVCAALGLPAAVVGFGSGMEQTKVGATMKELRAQAWEDCLIPKQRTMAGTIRHALLPDFEPRPRDFRVRWNYDDVPAMQENRKDIAEAAGLLLRAGIAKRSEAREMAGLPFGPEDDVYLLPLTTTEVVAGSASRPAPEDQIDPADPKGTKGRKEPTEFEERIIAASEPGSVTDEHKRLISRLSDDARKLSNAWTPVVVKFLDRLGRELYDAALTVIEPKASPEDEAIVAGIVDILGIDALKSAFEDMYGAQYLSVARVTYDSVGTTMGLVVGLSDDRAEAIVRAGGKRAGLVDFTESIRKRTFIELEKGRVLGEGPPALARRIRDFVPAGRFGSPKTRASVIARTETIHAQRMSTLDAYTDAKNVSRVIIFDDRLGYGDEECAALDGLEVSLSDANELAASEHPNGTRSFAPVVE